ncbi:MAG: hydrogenase expression/formation protein HypE [Thermoprotei archaeon]|jgi:hydrogenase expression/formation protein HypE
MDTILISHGNGGRETQHLLQQIIFSKVPEQLKQTIGGIGINYPDDGAVINLKGDKLIITTDSYTVNPIFFPGGDIGILAISGTINDLIMMGASPIAMLDSIVVSEGFLISDLEKILESMLSILKKYNIPLIGGDFKVMPSDSMKGIVINTVGIGITENPIIDIVMPEDKIIVTGPIGTHGAVIAAMQYGIQTSLKSDVKPLIPLLRIFNKYKDKIHAARDPTRGGLASTLNEWAQLAKKMIIIEESKVPILQEVKSITEITGLDPFVLANEGTAVLSVSPDIEKDIIKDLESLNFQPSTIGYVTEPKDWENKGIVITKTTIGGVKILEMPTGDIVPRIC